MIIGKVSLSATARVGKTLAQIEDITAMAYSEVVECIKCGNFWQAKERYKSLSFEDDFCAEQAMAKILAELYSRRKTGFRGNEDVVFNYGDNPTEFLRELHEIYIQFKHHKDSKPKTIGWKAAVILDGQEELQEEVR